MSPAIREAADVISSAKHLIAFTGAGISVESGIPPFRGEGGIWDRYDPRLLEIDYFYEHPKECWIAIREIFYEKFNSKLPNDAHVFLSALESRGILKLLVTQNIDELHFRAGSRNMVEYHGNARQLISPDGQLVPAHEVNIHELDDDDLPPLSPDGQIYKPDFVFFGEGIPRDAKRRASQGANLADAVLIIGSTGEVYPAAFIPRQAKQNGATIIEINPEDSSFTHAITDIHVKMKAATACRALSQILGIDISAKGEN